MANNRSIRLATNEELRALGWAAAARNEDGHFVSAMSHFASEDAWIEWINESVDNGLTVTFFARAKRRKQPA